MQRDERRALEDELSRRVHRSCTDYGLVSDGDRILVALSGGKDSYTLLDMLARVRRVMRCSFELVAVHLDQRQPGYDGAPLRRWLDAQDVPYEILSEDTYSVVIDHVSEGGTYCSMCSRLRRGILYSAAERLGCNKLALGHHRDDAIETFLMNFVHGGRLQAMPAMYTTDDGRFRVIRPLIECAEARIARYATLVGFPILPCNLCGSQRDLQRDAMAALITSLEREHPHVRAVMARALANVRPSHLLDRDLLRAWEARPDDLRPPHTPSSPRREHFEALPIAVSSRKRLPILP
jgi:tRNA 2-thiocytidine biosynthesis protein TtcA